MANVDQIITKITIQKRDKDRYNIYINEVYDFSVHEDVLVRHQLRKGMTLSDEQLTILKDDELKSKAYLDALNLLSFRPRTMMELRRKLHEKEYVGSVIDEVLERLQQNNLVDDFAFALQWVEERSSNKGKGTLVLRQELVQKGVSKELIDNALATISFDTQYESALQLANKRLDRFENDEWKEVYRKIGSLLSRRGYNSSIVSTVLSEVKQEWARRRQENSFS